MISFHNASAANSTAISNAVKLSSINFATITWTCRSRTEEGYRIVKFGEVGGVRGDLIEAGSEGLWDRLGEVVVWKNGEDEGEKDEKSNFFKMTGVFLSPPWNNTGYYTEELWKERKFSLKQDMEVGGLNGLELVDLVLEFVESLVLFLPRNCFDEDVAKLAEGGRNVEYYQHELNGKVKTSAAYVSSGEGK